MSIDKFNPAIPQISSPAPTSGLTPTGFDAKASKGNPGLAQSTISVPDSFGGIDTGRVGYYAAQAQQDGVLPNANLEANRLPKTMTGLHSPDMDHAAAESAPVAEATLPASSLSGPSLAQAITGHISAGIMAA